MTHFAVAGEVQWLGVRPDRAAPMLCPPALELRPLEGVVGDRYRSHRGSRQVTLIQAEHIDVVADLLGLHELPPQQLRRNIVVRGVNLLALLQRDFQLGSATLTATGRCQPCSKMERVLGFGGYNAMRGHGGITANVLTGGIVRIGDQLIAGSAAAAGSTEC